MLRHWGMLIVSYRRSLYRDMSYVATIMATLVQLVSYFFLVLSSIPHPLSEFPINNSITAENLTIPFLTLFSHFIFLSS